MASEAQRRAVAKYDSRMTKTYALKLNIKTDADLIEMLEKQDNIQGYIKELIRRDRSSQK